MKRDLESRRAELPDWSYIFLGFLAPITTLRFGQINLTWFDLAVVLMGTFVFLKGVPRRAPGRVVSLGYLIVLGLVIAALRAPDPWSAIMHILQWGFIFFVVVPVTYSAFRSGRALWLVSVGLVIAMTVVAIYGVYEVVFLPKPYRLYRYGSIFGDPQLLGFQISVMLPFLIFFLKQVRQISHKRLVNNLASLFALALCGALTWLLAYSLSRTGAFATVAGVLVFFLLNAGVEQPGSKKLATQLGLFLALLSAAFTVSQQGEIAGRILSRLEASLSWESPDVADRTAVWQEALTGIDPTYYLVGVGPDNYQNISQFGRKPHDAFLLLLVEGGLLVMFAFVLLLATFFIETLSALRQAIDPLFRDFLIATIASMAAYVVIALLNTQTISRFYWFVFALGLATASYVQRSFKKGPATGDTSTSSVQARRPATGGQ
ncbi:MAG TPA: O-antigen ligase family protein [Anaerolineae bacterium]